MAETYCGKSCAECGKREMLNCPGCKAGPGRQFGGDCDLARCVFGKGHETCGTCSYKGNCGNFQSRDFQPDYRRRKLEQKAAEQEAIAKRAPVLGKWLWILFWLVIPANVASIMTLDMVAEAFPAVASAGHLLNFASSVVYCGILFLLRDVDDGYRTAGICHFIATSVSIFVDAFTDGSGWTLLITLPSAVVSMIATYNEYMAHSAVLCGVDRDLSEKWEKLWKWEIGLIAAMFGSIVVMLIIPILGALVILAAAIGSIVVAIMKLVYLYRTAKCFREYVAPQDSCI